MNKMEYSKPIFKYSRQLQSFKRVANTFCACQTKEEKKGIVKYWENIG